MLILVAGGQFGGEGKGNVVASLAATMKPSAIVKTGGPNSSHTYGDRNSRRLWRLRTLPAGSESFEGVIIFPAGSLVNPTSLLSEIEETRTRAEIVIDPRAGVVLDRHIEWQRSDSERYSMIGSTLTGTGAASAERCLRRLPLAREIADLHPYLGDTQVPLVHLASGPNLGIIEGAQSYGLSNVFGNYPYVTSRDSSLPGIWAQLGISTKFLDLSILVLKAFPTRNSHGDTRPTLYGEEELSDALGSSQELLELGGGNYNGGDKRRRVGLFDWEETERTVFVMKPDFIAITGLDHIDSLQNIDLISSTYGSSEDFVRRLEDSLRTRVGITGRGPQLNDVTIKPILEETVRRIIRARI